MPRTEQMRVVALYRKNRLCSGQIVGPEIAFDFGSPWLQGSLFADLEKE